MITVATNVLSGSSRTNMRAKTPKNAPTVMSSLKLFAHCRGERESHAHQFDVLLDGSSAPRWSWCEVWNASTSSAKSRH